MAPDQAEMLNDVSIYVGETLRKNLGGTWSISFDNESDAYHGVPVIKDYGVHEETIAPLFLVTASVDRRERDFFCSLYEANTG